VSCRPAPPLAPGARTPHQLPRPCLKTLAPHTHAFEIHKTPPPPKKTKHSLINELAFLSTCAAAADHPGAAAAALPLPGAPSPALPPLPPSIASTRLATVYEALGDCASSLDPARHDRLLGAVLGAGAWGLPKVRKPKKGKKGSFFWVAFFFATQTFFLLAACLCAPPPPPLPFLSR